jgi:hypothetical protein
VQQLQPFALGCKFDEVFAKLPATVLFVSGACMLLQQYDLTAALLYKQVLQTLSLTTSHVRYHCYNVSDWH